ncbi:putative glycoside hydrolase [Microlunatus phosphovorus NM-1]|uniref:Putative glycoside hydrolase n=1 Tax=Microlunatus phosphovorus (strain ATCC 700054 / DSM 10555 / JCM 9379 / NBRC 101784 / NCIMB 13414 / VKM Ac-1990 / NM-1) TaxID=1032480 RepID=F5XFY7_MICPN|nr:putative glycoside hydrolase [Microlunatus phosphovorus NM-1]
MLAAVILGTLIAAPADLGAPTPDASAAVPKPLGPTGNWKLVFSDDFNGKSVNRKKWTDRSSSQSDHGRGNKKNKQLEWNRHSNCSVSKGVLTQTAKRTNIKSPSGVKYKWTSCLLTSTPSFSFQYGYIEIRSKLPAKRGFWPSFWTWQTPSNNRWTETDVYEFFSDNPKALYVAQQSGRAAGCTVKNHKFNPSKAFHVYGADIKPTGTVFYVDGKQVCSTLSTSTGPTNIVISNFVYSKRPPSPKAKGKHHVDYVRAWQR